MRKKFLSLILLGILCSIGNYAWGEETSSIILGYGLFEGISSETSVSSESTYSGTSVQSEKTFSFSVTLSNGKIKSGNIQITSGSNTAALTITAPTGYVMTKIVGTFSSKKVNTVSTTPSNSSATETTNTAYTWEGSSNSVIFNLTSGSSTNTEFKSVVITYSAAVPATSSTISHGTATNGSFTISVAGGAATSENTSATSGQTITLAATPDPGYELASWSVYKTGDQATTVTVSNNQFTMPAYGVTVDATFSQLKYTTPTISPTNGSTFTGNSQEITITATGADHIYYTLDGSDPTSASTEYTAAFNISSTKTIKAIAVKDGYANSDVASATITKIEMLTQTSVTASRTWDWSKLSAVEELTGETTQKNTDEFVMANMDGVRYTQNLGFNSNFTQDMAREIVISKTQYVRRDGSGNTFQNGTIKITLGVPGTLQVFFTGTSSKNQSGDNARYLVVNSVKGSVGTDNTTQKDETFKLAAGDVTISFESGKQLRIQKIIFTPVTSVSKTITAAGWATYCSPYALDFSSAITNLKAAYFVTDGVDGVLTLSEVTGTVPANTGLLLKGEGNCVIPTVASSNTDVSANQLEGVTSSTTLSAEAGYVLMASPKLGFYKNKNAFTLGANTAYLPVGFAASDPSAAPAHFLLEDEENGATSLEDIHSSIEAIKFFENGQLYIMRGGVIYDVTGRIIK